VGGGWGLFRENRVRVFLFALDFFYLLIVSLCKFFLPKVHMLVVHLYRKSLYVIFKKILQ